MLESQIRAMRSAAIQGKANELIAKSLMAAVGAGSAYGGLRHFSKMFKRPPEEKTDFKIPIKTAEVGGGLSSFLSGAGADNVLGVPYFLPSMLAGVPLAAYGGYKLTDSVLDANRDQQETEKLNKLKSHFNNLLAAKSVKSGEDAVAKPLNSLQKAAELKLEFSEAIKSAEDRSSSSELGDSLDRLCDMLEKFADDRGEMLKSADWLRNLAGTGTGAYLTYAAISPLIAGKLMYDIAAEKAKRKRKTQAAAKSAVPRPLHAVPASVPPKLEDKKQKEPLEPLV